MSDYYKNVLFYIEVISKFGMKRFLFCLNALLRCSLSYAKIVQTERRASSLLERFAEVQPILCKDSANRAQSVKLA